MTFDSLLAALRDTDVMVPLLCSLLTGAVIGAEREWQGKSAGLRTQTLVCFASALMTLLGLRMAEWTVALPEGTQVVSDMARMPHAILTGIGFLGAGVIYREGATVQGLTTAASLWLTAALGIVYGAGLLELAVIGTVIAFAVLVMLRMAQWLKPPKPEIRIEIAVTAASSYDGAALTADLAAQGLGVIAMSLRQDWASGLRHYMLLASGHGQIDCDRLRHRLADREGMQLVAIFPLELDPGAGS